MHAVDDVSKSVHDDTCETNFLEIVSNSTHLSSLTSKHPYYQNDHKAGNLAE